MLASTAALELIKKHEGLRLRSYLDQAGKWTIGWGHTGDDIGQGMIIGLADAIRYLAEDLHFVEYALTRMIVHEIKQQEFDACCSLAFNIGTEAFRRSTLLKFLNFGESKKAAEEFLRWCKVTLPNGKKISVPGLTNRRAAEREYFLTGKLNGQNFP